MLCLYAGIVCTHVAMPCHVCQEIDFIVFVAVLTARRTSCRMRCYRKVKGGEGNRKGGWVFGVEGGAWSVCVEALLVLS